MMRRGALFVLLLCLPAAAPAQESLSGVSMTVTLAAGGFYTGRTNEPDGFRSKWTGGGRAMLYPTLRFNRNWYVASAVQTATESFFYENFDEGEYDLRVDVLQAFLAYERYAGPNIFRFKAGRMSTAFGSYVLDYDDGRNPLIDIPSGYGYYYAPVSTLGFTGAEIDATIRKTDLRVQAATSSPASRRGLRDNGQYLNWAGGVGYTIRQGFRVGASAYHGPYLYQGHRFYFPGELDPQDLPATGYGLDAQFARGHLDLSGELQRHELLYTKIPTLRRWTGYAQARYAFLPRWFVAGRWGGESSIAPLNYRSFEAAIGYRPNRRQIIKTSYELVRSNEYRGASGGVIGVQLVTQLDALERAF
jgi:hypothetical protein